MDSASSASVARSAGRYRGRGPRAAILVADYVRAAIVEGEIKAGDALPAENVLMEQFGVSRPTLREALRVLESEGLLTVNRGPVGGFRVHVPNPEVAAQFAGRVLQHRGASSVDILEARSILESQCAKVLTERGRARDLTALQECLDAGSHELALNDAGPIAAHRAFHELVVELSGNATVALMSTMLGHILHQEDARLKVVPEVFVGGHGSREAQNEHAELIELIKLGDAEPAEQLWKRHVGKGC